MDVAHRKGNALRVHEVPCFVQLSHEARGPRGEAGEDANNRLLTLVQADVTIAEHEEGRNSQTDGFELFQGNVRRAIIVVPKTPSLAVFGQNGAPTVRQTVRTATTVDVQVTSFDRSVSGAAVVFVGHAHPR